MKRVLKRPSGVQENTGEEAKRTGGPAHCRDRHPAPLPRGRREGAIRRSLREAAGMSSRYCGHR